MSNPVLTDFYTDTITINRAGVGSYVDGVFESSIDLSFDIPAVVQPASSRDKVVLPEAQRQSDMIKIYCDDEILIVDELVGSVSDTIIWRGREYEAINVTVWQNVGDLAHYKVIAKRIDSNNDKRVVK